jgi:hypothetical protein
MAPPGYTDLGKSARDLFSKGYNFGFMKIDTTTKSGDNAEFKTGASHNIGTGKLFGSLDIKYKIPDYGMTLTEKWNTDNTLGTEVVVQDKLAKGLKLTFDSQYSPMLNKRSGKVKVEHTCDRVHANADLALDVGPIVNGSVVFGHQGWLVGYQTGYDTQKAKMTQSNIAFGRSQGDYTLHTFINDSSEFGGSLYHKVNKRLELGANLGWTRGDQSTRFGLAGKFEVDNKWTIRAKLNNSSQLAFATTHQLNPCLKLTLSSLVNLQGFQEGGHKLGVGLEFEPDCAHCDKC